MDKLGYSKLLYHGRANLPYTITNLEKSQPIVTPPSFFPSSAFYTQSKPTPAFLVKATYTPPLAYLKLRKWCFLKLHWLLVCFGQLFNEIHIVRNWKFTHALQ